MSTMNKTPLGTIAASRWTNGINLGMYGMPILSLEFNPKTNKMDLVINDDAVNAHQIAVKHVSEQEFSKPVEEWQMNHTPGQEETHER